MHSCTEMNLIQATNYCPFNKTELPNNFVTTKFAHSVNEGLK